MQVVNFGRAKIRVHAEGCVGCGTEHSTSWHPAMTVKVQVGGHKLDVQLNRCGDCEYEKSKGRAVASRSAPTP